MLIFGRIDWFYADWEICATIGRIDWFYTDWEICATIGYTYGWGNPKSEIGLSEFVIKQGATVKIDSVYCTSEYCSKYCK